ncbi:type II and III secretion system protein family protein [Aurantimonas sp. VKM B-3413]|uniref:type II and III secretion system protein family protein n=1 Tax=Aurantimonas sp. VKM B-3413 TaxID=2779401 RepID=UPI001E2C3714|nr:type II and III secretion system protein family protein [Aurantimonas sp. VKM B-3413]MCB8836817.1 type II and III secretion system protein family protein [Aurantimonas sp. VKM B-3413]
MTASMPTQRIAAALRQSVLGLAALSTALVPFAMPVPALAEQAVVNARAGQQTINLGLNKSKVIVLSADAHDILVANPAVADAVTRDARRIYIFGKQIGQTNIVVFDAQNRQIASIDLKIERDISGLEATIRKYVPNSNVSVEMLNDNVVLTGSVQTPQDASKVERLARVFVTGGEGTTGQYIQSATAPGGSQGGNGDVAFASEDRRQSQIINLLQIAGEDQVTLKVTVAEVQRSVVKQLGLNGSVNDGISYANMDNPFAFGKALSNSYLGLSKSFGDYDVTAQLNALEQAGVMKTLAEPSLTAISGEKASFKVGGEFTIPQGQEYSPGTPAYQQFKGYDGSGQPIYETVPAVPATRQLDNTRIEYGIGLDFSPVVLSAGRISLKIRTSVSEPTFENPYHVSGGADGGVGAVGIRKRLADTTVELPSGGSLVIAGLVRNETRQVLSGYPGLSKIPVLGSLFRSRDFQHYETELVVIVTPYLVRPVARQALARPDDGLNFSSDGSANFLGRLNRVYGHMETDLPPGRYHGVVGYIYK